MKRQLFIILIFTVLTGCNGLHVGVGLKGEIVDEDTIVLEGDTFTIQVCLLSGTMSILKTRLHAIY